MWVQMALNALTVPAVGWVRMTGLPFALAEMAVPTGMSASWARAAPPAAADGAGAAAAPLLLEPHAASAAMPATPAPTSTIRRVAQYSGRHCPCAAATATSSV